VREGKTMAKRKTEDAAKSKTRTKTSGRAISIPRLEIEVAQIQIIGISSLICHKFSDKARRTMLGKQMGEASPGRQKKDPKADYEECLYQLNGGFGFPATGFKKSAVEACTSLKGSITKVQARQSHFVMPDEGALVKIRGKPRMREDTVRLGGKTADIRFRAEFPDWECILTIRYNKSVLSLEELVNLYNIAGFAVGIGDWRPEKNGSNGQYRVA